MKYIKTQSYVAYEDTVYTVTEYTPELHKDERQARRNEIEKILYAVFSKYALRKRTQKQEGVCKI